MIGQRKRRCARSPTTLRNQVATVAADAEAGGGDVHEAPIVVEHPLRDELQPQGQQRVGSAANNTIPNAKTSNVGSAR